MTLEEKQKHPLWSDFWNWAERNRVHPSFLDLAWEAFLAGVEASRKAQADQTFGRVPDDDDHKPPFGGRL